MTASGSPCQKPKIQTVTEDGLSAERAEIQGLSVPPHYLQLYLPLPLGKYFTLFFCLWVLASSIPHPTNTGLRAYYPSGSRLWQTLLLRYLWIKWGYSQSHYRVEGASLMEVPTKWSRVQATKERRKGGFKEEVTLGLLIKDGEFRGGEGSWAGPAGKKGQRDNKYKGSWRWKGKCVP